MPDMAWEGGVEVVEGGGEGPPPRMDIIPSAAAMIEDVGSSSCTKVKRSFVVTGVGTYVQ